ncbi:hypothetical protein Taro_055161 [Colocasia esculenta]|uniref:B box-type domain-containing protein n=1 Tax=Colocasia esculenta TaxID=4460 RepID=A0A843XSR8_COLES|nr:hypothetical protein [Colocasia esculenta]
MPAQGLPSKDVLRRFSNTEAAREDSALLLGDPEREAGRLLEVYQPNPDPDPDPPSPQAAAAAAAAAGRRFRPLASRHWDWTGAFQLAISTRSRPPLYTRTPFQLSFFLLLLALFVLLSLSLSLSLRLHQQLHMAATTTGKHGANVLVTSSPRWNEQPQRRKVMAACPPLVLRFFPLHSSGCTYSRVRDSFGQVGFRGGDEGVPQWLETLLGEKFFNPCLVHAGARKNERNIFCLDCCTSFCPHCLPAHPPHRLLQVHYLSLATTYVATTPSALLSPELSARR